MVERVGASYDRTVPLPAPTQLAEAVTLDGGALLIALVIVAIIAALALAVLVAGCRWALLAGRGSSDHLGLWLAVLCVELGPLLAARSLGGAETIGLGAAAVQLGFWGVGRTRRTRSPPPPDTPWVGPDDPGGRGTAG